MAAMFPALPEDLSALTDDELAALEAEHVEVALRIESNDADLIGDRTASQVVDEMTAGVEAVERVRAEMAMREEGRREYAETVESLASRIRPEETVEAVEEPAADELAADTADDEPDEPTVEEETVEQVDAEPVTAAAQLRLPPRATRSREPVVADDKPRQALVASAGIEGVAEGHPLDRTGLATAMIRKRERFVSTPKGVREEVIVASAQWKVPEDRWLRANDPHGNDEKVRNVVSEDAIVASGGTCAPNTPWYDLMTLSVPDRPVRDALASFMADRGGIRVAPPATLADITSAITHVTHAEDEQGGTFATKDCQVVSCPVPVDVEVDIVARCLQFGNLVSRAWPELVAQWTELAMAAHARTAEGLLLDGIAANSTAVTAGPTYGATATLLDTILNAAAGMRSRHRIRRGVQLRLLLPAWTSELLISDLRASAFDRFAYTVDGVTELLRAHGVEPTFYLDEATGAGQVYGAQAAGALNPWPTTIVAYMYPEGSHLFLDGGTLDLGLVRDSVLNQTNDYQVFAETFENTAYIGIESLEITITVCPDGTVAPAGTAITCTT